MIWVRWAARLVGGFELLPSLLLPCWKLTALELKRVVLLRWLLVLENLENLVDSMVRGDFLTVNSHNPGRCFVEFSSKELKMRESSNSLYVFEIPDLNFTY